MKEMPELASDKNFKSLSDSVDATVDRVFEAIPAHLKSLGVQFDHPDDQLDYELEISALKRYANREIEILKREVELRMANRGARGERKGWRWRSMDRTNQLLTVLLASILAVAAVFASLNHKVLPYWLIFGSALVFVLLIGREVWQRKSVRVESALRHASTNAQNHVK